MATSFDEIYGLNQVIQNNRDLKCMPDNLYYYTLYQYLVFAISKFRKKCFQDLTTRTNFQQEVYNFVGDGIQTDFVLSPSPPTGSTFYVEVGESEIPSTGYTFNTLTDTLSFTTAPTGAGYVGAYIVGEFDADLNDEVKTILAIAMNIPFSDNQIFSTDAMRQIMYSSGVNFASQANHNKTNNTIKQDLNHLVDQMIADYSYLNSPNDLAGLVGGLGG